MLATSIVQGMYESYGVYSQNMVTELINLLKPVLGFSSIPGFKLFKSLKVFSRRKQREVVMVAIVVFVFVVQVCSARRRGR
jgi:hypothetical protein